MGYPPALGRILFPGPVGPAPGDGPRGKAMADSQSGKLHLWEGWKSAFFAGARPAPSDAVGAPALAGPHYPREFAQRLYAGDILPSGQRVRGEAEPNTLQWFLDIEKARHGRHGRWIPRLLEFGKHGGEKLLGLGPGVGTDWVQYARHGAEVVACCPWPEQLALVRRNFELRSLTGQFLHAHPSSLPLDSATIDVACVSSVLQNEAEFRAVIEEVYRVLKPGGKVLALARAWWDVDFWKRCFPWHGWWKRRAATGAVPVTCYSAKALRGLFGRFVEHRVYKRQLRRLDLPHLWRWLPLPLLERVMGRVLVLKAFKPLSAALGLPVAA